jgi:putative iron-regulated protein
MRCKGVLSVLLVLGAVLAAGCRGDYGAGVSGERKAAVAERYADLVYASYGASVAGAERMSNAIDRLVDHPAQARLSAARRAWIAARDDYVVTEPFRFYGGPIDDPQTGPEGLMNAWPMDEAYVDYVAGDPRAGIVNDRAAYPKITEDVIVEGNEKGGETNISSGWHAIEFLLWGQDRSADGPGARPASDYATAPNARRRATYLRLATKRLVSDLRHVRAPWAPDGAYRASFLGDPDAAMTKIFRGIGALSSHELTGERMAVAFESKDQEDEHSCFSDNTNADVVNDLKGIRMAYSGTGRSDDAVNAASLSALVTEADPALGRQVSDALDGSLAKAQAFPATFETMIAAPSGSPANTALARTIDAVEAQSALLKRAAKALDVKVSFGG